MLLLCWELREPLRGTVYRAHLGAPAEAALRTCWDPPTAHTSTLRGAAGRLRCGWPRPGGTLSTGESMQQGTEPWAQHWACSYGGTGPRYPHCERRHRRSCWALMEGTSPDLLEKSNPDCAHPRKFRGAAPCKLYSLSADRLRISLAYVIKGNVSP